MRPPFGESDNSSEEYVTIHSESDLSCQQYIQYKYQAGGTSDRLLLQ
jgi:hypothetical protein